MLDPLQEALQRLLSALSLCGGSRLCNGKTLLYLPERSSETLLELGGCSLTGCSFGGHGILKSMQSCLNLALCSRHLGLSHNRSESLLKIGHHALQLPQAHG